jgi:hypothetical protein
LVQEAGKAQFSAFRPSRGSSVQSAEFDDQRNGKR